LDKEHLKDKGFEDVEKIIATAAQQPVEIFKT